MVRRHMHRRGVRHTAADAGRVRFGSVRWVIVAAVRGVCARRPRRAPSITPPPVPADLVPWPDIVWTAVDGLADGERGLGEQVIAVTVERRRVRGGRLARDAVRRATALIWFSDDGQTW